MISIKPSPACLSKGLTKLTFQCNFLIGGLADGAYRVVFVPIEGYLGEELTGVNVTAGDTTDVGVVVISHL